MSNDGRVRAGTGALISASAWGTGSMFVTPKAPMRSGSVHRWKYDWGGTSTSSLDIAFSGFQQAKEIFAANLSELRGVYNFSPHAFFRAILQYQSTSRNPYLHASEVDRESKRAFVQLLFSYKINPQTVFFLLFGQPRSFLDSTFRRVPITRLTELFSEAGLRLAAMT
ncbi:hypothetical protein MJD09_23550 [bacterium]|nr:hypothetical protein [bacterium]